MHSNFNILILNVVLKFQYSDQLLIFQSNSNNLIDFHFCNRISTFGQSPLFRSNFNILIDFTFCTQISIVWLIPTLLHSNVNFLIDSPLFTQNTSLWTIWLLALKFQHFDFCPQFQYSDRFLSFQTNSNILIDFHFCNRISTFNRSPLFPSNFTILIDPTLLYSNFNSLISSHLIGLKRQLFDWFPTFHYQHFDQFWRLALKFQHFWSIPNFVLKFQYSDRFLSFQTNSNILIDSHFKT